MVNEAGQLLREILRNMGVDASTVRMNYAVRCAPWHEKDKRVKQPTAPQLRHCIPSLLEDIKRTRPKAIITLGSIATKAITQTTAGIKSIRGSMQQITIGDQVYPVMPTLDTETLRQSNYDRTIATFICSDIQEAMAIASGQAQVTSPYAGRDYKMIESLDELREYMAFLDQHLKANPGSYITADFESGALQDWKPENPMLGLGISHAAYQGRFIPMYHWQSPLKDHMDEVIKILQPMADMPVANQNIKFDYQWFRRRLGITLNNIYFDTMLAHHCKFAGMRPNGLETMAGLYLNEPAWSYALGDSVSKNITYLKAQKKATKDVDQKAYWDKWLELGSMGKGYAIASLEDLAHYGCIDVDTTFRLVPVLWKMLEESQLLGVYKSLYHDAIGVFGDMQFDGIAVDRRVVAQLKESIPAEMVKIELEIAESPYAKQALQILGKDPQTERLNMGSPQQMSTLIYDALKMPPARLRGKSPRTTEQDQLTQLLGMCKRKGKKRATKILELIGSWRSLDKYLGSYVDSNIACMDINSLVHPTWKIEGTRTGRFACETPPVHSAPVKHGLRKQYYSRWHEDGGLVLGADESQIEVRIFGSIADDIRLIEFYCNMVGADLHRYMASLLFEVPYEQVTTDQRRIAKTCVFASLYGGGFGNLVSQTGMTKGQAQVVFSKFTQMIAIDRFKKEKTTELEQFGFVTTPFGRCLPIDLGRTEGQYQHAIRQAMNTPIQSSASDLVAAAIARAHYYMKQMGLKSKIIIFHHDAIYWDVFPGELFTLIKLAQKVMVEEPQNMYPWLKVPLKIGIEFGSSWGSKMEVDSFDEKSLTIRFKANTDEESCYDRYYEQVVSQFEGPMGKVLQLQNIQASPREVVALVTPRVA